MSSPGIPPSAVTVTFITSGRGQNCNCHANLVAHDCGYPLSRYTCRATRVAADFLDFKAFCRCSTGVALHPLKLWVSHLSSPPGPGRCHIEIWSSEKVSRYTGVSQVQLRVSRYTVQLSMQMPQKNLWTVTMLLVMPLWYYGRKTSHATTSM